LKRFGLLEELGSPGQRQAKLTELARVILRSPDETEVREAIEVAALNPPIHREMWETYGSSLPSEANLQWKLQTQRGFTESGAADFVKQYKETLAFAQANDALQGPGARAKIEQPTGNPHDGRAGDPGEGLLPKPETQTVHPASIPSASNPAIKRIPLLLVGGEEVVVEAAFPISEAAWDNLVAVLAAMKPGLVRQALHQGATAKRPSVGPLQADAETQRE